MKVFVIIFLITSNILARDVSVDTTLTKDSINIPLAVNVLMPEERKDWFEKHEGLIGAIAGSIIGSFFAGLIAFLSINATRKQQEKQEEKMKDQSENTYILFLYSIHSILIAHKSFAESRKKLFPAIILHVQKTGELPFNKVHLSLNTDILKTIFMQLLSYSEKNILIITNLIIYLNIVEDYYKYLDFTSLEIKKDDPNYKRVIELYFKDLSGKLELLLENIDENIAILAQELGLDDAKT